MIGVDTWHIVTRVSGGAAAGAVFAILDDAIGAVSAFETMPGDWRIEAYSRAPALTPDLSGRLALAAAGAGGALVDIAETMLAERDWVAENQLAFPPLRIGRFFIYGSHHQGGVPAGMIGITLDAAAAFGTGEHPSTRGCLIALDRLTRRHRFRRPLDIGTGTGILAIAAAKLNRRRVTAQDIDAGAVRIARRNVAANGLAPLVRANPAPGYRGRALSKSRYDLVLSNILARPLALLAADLKRHLAPGGRAVLSGLLRRQEPIVLAAHRGVGIALEGRIAIDGWSTLILRNGGLPSGAASKTTMGAAAPIDASGRIGHQIRRPFSGRRRPLSRHGQARLQGRAVQCPAPAHVSPSGEYRYPPASDRRATSTRHKRVPDATGRIRPYPPRRTD